MFSAALFAEKGRVKPFLFGIAELLYPHFEMILLSERGDFFHHGTFMVEVKGILVLPSVDQEHRFGIVHRQKIFIAKIALFGADALHKSARSARIDFMK